MTNVRSRQEVSASAASALADGSVDALVPPLWPRPRALFCAVAVLAALATMAALPRSGLVVPDLRWTGEDMSWGGSRHDLGMQFEVRNEGIVAVSVVGVDARAPGLVGGRGKLSSASTGGAVGFPYRLRPGSVVDVDLTFTGVDCDRIHLRGSQVVGLSARGPLGVTLTASVPMPWADAPSGFYSFSGTSDPYSISWAAGITWHVCRGGNGANPLFW